MLNAEIKPEIGTVDVKTTQNKGLSPEYWTERIVERLIAISDNADPMVQAQAKAFKSSIENLILLYIKQAILSDRATVAGLLEKQGHKDMADILRRI